MLKVNWSFFLIFFFSVHLHARRTSELWDSSNCRYWRSRTTAVNWPLASVAVAECLRPGRPPRRRPPDLTHFSAWARRNATRCSGYACASTRAVSSNNSSSSQPRHLERPRQTAVAGPVSATTRPRPWDRTIISPTRICTTVPLETSPAQCWAATRSRWVATQWSPQPILLPITVTEELLGAIWRCRFLSAGP